VEPGNEPVTAGRMPVARKAPPALATGEPNPRRVVLAQAGPAIALLLAFFVLPILALVRISLYPGDRPFGAGAAGMSLRHYGKVFGDPFYLGVLGDTLVYGLVVAVVTLVIGFPVGYSLARMPARARRWRITLVILPLTLSLVVNVFGWLVILGGSGLVNSVLLAVGLVDAPLRLLFNRWAVILVLAHTFLPFQILSIMSVVAQIDPALEEAAASLRAGWWGALRRVILPLAYPGIVAGSTLVFILTISAFVTPRLVGGARVQMLGSLIYEQIVVVLNWPFGAAMSFILLGLSLVVIAAINRSLGSRFFARRS
jgi:putative spermidine/putrescine transport system permease protein